MKVTDYLADALAELGIETVFGYQGSNATHLIDSITKRGIRYLQNHHEQASAFSACALSESKGIAAAVASSGPGAINLISGIANAYFDSEAVIFLTGQINTRDFKPNKNLRQYGFQEFDIVTAVKDFTKFAVTVAEAKDIKYYFEKAVSLSLSGRKGPVLLDIPHNVAAADVQAGALLGFLKTESGRLVYSTDGYREPAKTDSGEIRAVFDRIKQSKRPLILFGGGAYELRGQIAKELVSRWNCPAVASLKGLDILPHDSGYFAGFIGSYGNRFANLAVAASDLIVVLGSRLDLLQTGPGFAKNAEIIQVDIDGDVLSTEGFQKTAIKTSCLGFAEELLRISEGVVREGVWLNRVRELKERFPAYNPDDEKTLPNGILRAASELLEPGDAITADVGQNQMWTAASVFLKENMRLFNSGGLGTMGFALPAAIGAYIAGAKKVLSVSGDGGIQMNIQELMTVSREKINAKIMIINNASLGLIRSYQQIIFQNETGSVTGFSSPDYPKIADAYGLRYARIERAEDVERSAGMFRDGEPAIFEVVLPVGTEVHPGPSYQKEFFDMAPLLGPGETEKILASLTADAQ